jgi:hypothetical protein
MSIISFSGKQPNYTAYIKTFPFSPLSTNTTWTNTTISNAIYLTPSNSNASVYIKKDLLVGGSINNPSDFKSGIPNIIILGFFFNKSNINS